MIEQLLLYIALNFEVTVSPLIGETLDGRGTDALDIPCQIALSCFFLLCQFQAFVKRRP